MINAGSGGIDPSNARPFASYAGGQPQGGGDAIYQQPAGGYAGLQSSFGMQGQVPGSRQAPGIGSMPMGQPGQGRFPSSNLSNQLQQQLGQQYGQAAGRGGLPGGQMLAMNGLGGGRGSPAPAPPQGSAPQQRGSLDLSGTGAGLSGPDSQQRSGGGLGISGGFAGSGFTGGGGLRGGPGGSPARPLGAGGLHASGDLMPMLDGGSGSGGTTSMAAAAGGKFSQAAGRQLSAGGGAKADAPITFDESDFPSLGGGPARPAGVTADGGTANPGGGGGSATGPPPITAASATLGPDPYMALSLGKGQEFNMQPEEFPALPGAPRPGPPPASSEAGDASKSDPPGGEGQGQPQTGRALGGGGDPQGSSGAGPAVALPPGHPNYDQMQRFYQQQAAARGAAGGAAAGAGADPKPSGGGASGAQGQPDRFGLLGLLSVIRMTDPDLTTLALGTDLTTLGLNLNSPDNLHKTFASPWADGPLKAEPDFKVPACYLHNPPRLQPGYFAKFQQDTLFYIFYSMPGDEAQLLAADELSARQWWFHKEFKLWLTRIPNTEPIMKTERFERGAYLVFDTTTWDAVRKDNFVVHYDSLERPPDLPRPAPGSGAAAPGAGPGGASAVKPPGAGGLAPGGAL